MPLWSSITIAYQGALSPPDVTAHVCKFPSTPLDGPVTPGSKSLAWADEIIYPPAEMATISTVRNTCYYYIHNVGRQTIHTNIPNGYGLLRNYFNKRYGRKCYVFDMYVWTCNFILFFRYVQYTPIICIWSILSFVLLWFVAGLSW